ncbi:hypothetical protein GGS26DRAFT_590881 [Hypomontagnella submonticulosa]|nr:hypothetical protein GGS26DRAFT_590881 [Hypomontagnella submonticulosa]
MIDTITERYGERRYSEYELPYGPADRSLYFPWLLVTVQSSIFEAHHQLRAGMAMALVSGKDWTGYDNGIFGLAVDCTLARLFVSCIDISDREAGPRYLSKKLQAFGLSQGVHVKGLQGILVKIHIWGIRSEDNDLGSATPPQTRKSISYLEARHLSVRRSGIQNKMASFKVNGNFAKDFVIAIAVAAVVTVVVLTIICVLAQCGPRIFGRVTRRENWFGPRIEEGTQQELPLPAQRIFVNDTGDLSAPQCRGTMTSLRSYQRLRKTWARKESDTISGVRNAGSD